MMNKNITPITTNLELNTEVTANKYCITCMHTCMITIASIWFLNLINIFKVDNDVINATFFFCAVIYLIGLTCSYFSDLSKAHIKYLIIFWASSMFTVINTFLTFHALLSIVIPILYSSMYTSRKLQCYTYVLTVFSIIISVFIGYHYGLCDINMVLLSGKPLSAYLGANNTFLLTEINDELFRTLTIFFILPRCIISGIVLLICNRISQVIRLNMTLAHQMEVLAETDVMTGIYNKSKYTEIIEKGFDDDEEIGILFWDLNNLKEANITMGHEYGDRLIITLAESIRAITSDTDKAYRVGGDEFIMILKDTDDIRLSKKLNLWLEIFEKTKIKANLPLSVSYGYANGLGKDIKEVINKADMMMYRNKYNKEF